MDHQNTYYTRKTSLRWKPKTHTPDAFKHSTHTMTHLNTLKYTHTHVSKQKPTAIHQFQKFVGP